LPDVKLVELEGLGAGARARILRRLVAYARDVAEELVGPLRGAALGGFSAAARGLLYQLEQGLGTALVEGAAAQLGDLRVDDHSKLEALGVTLGERVLYVSRLLRGPLLRRRCALATAFTGASLAPRWPRPSDVSLPVSRGVDPRLYMTIGYPTFGPRAVR